jgi:hypothetical protein
MLGNQSFTFYSIFNQALKQQKQAYVRFLPHSNEEIYIRNFHTIIIK